MPQVLNDQVKQMLESSGWSDHRDATPILELPTDFELFPAASNALKSFGMLNLGLGGTGVDRGRSTLNLNPSLADGESDRLKSAEMLVGEHLYPLGEVDSGHGFLCIDTHGRVFWVMDFVQFVAENIEEALEVLLLGKKGRALQPEFWIRRGIRMI